MKTFYNFSFFFHSSTTPMKRIATTCLLILCIACCAFADGRFAIAHGPYLQNVRETEATIVWVANKPSIGWVELAPDDGSNYYAVERPRYFDTTNGVKNTSTLHTVKLTGLKPGTNYRYRVYATEVTAHSGWRVTYGETEALDVFYSQPPMFRTLDTKKPEASFAVINDIHARAGDITKLLNAADFKQKDLVFFNGDMLSNLVREEQIFTGFMDESIKLFAREKPFYYARGNHETRGEFATMFQRYFSPREPHLYFMFSQGPVCFIVLDTGEDKPDTDLEYCGITDYDNYRTEQAAWLAQAVKSDEYRRAKWHVVIAHVPPRPARDLWHGQYEVLQKFVPILNEAGTDVMLCGHLHRHILCQPDSEVHFPVVVNSLNHVISGHTDGSTLHLDMYDTKGALVEKFSVKAK